MSTAQQKTNTRECLRKYSVSREMMESLKFLITVFNDDTVPLDMRIEAAGKVLPYQHRKKPVALEVTGKFEFLSPDERKMRRELLLEEFRARQVKVDPENN